jgi:hypothetical protein
MMYRDRNRVISVWLTKAEKEKFEEIAMREDRSMASLARVVIHAWLVEQGYIEEEEGRNED